MNSFQPGLVIEDYAARIQRGWSSREQGDNLNRLRGLIKRLADDENRGLIPFGEFSRLLSQELAGLVLTAHPTFALSDTARHWALDLIAGLSEQQEQLSHLRPLRSPTLDEELAQSEQAILNIRRAIREITGLAIDVAAELYPDDYRSFAPGFITVATWVGFDLDGRTDIGWSKSLEFRYRLALSGLAELSELLTTIELVAEGDGAPLIEPLTATRQGLDTFKSCFELGIRTLAETSQNKMGLAKLNQLAMDNRARKQAAMVQVDAALDNLIALDISSLLLRSLLVFRAEWFALGLGLSHVHFRLNAVQLHNAIRSEIALERAPDKSASRRFYLSEIAQLLDTVEPVNVHYGTLAAEQTTAKRLFMLAAQFEKHFDGRTPIRLLVAESDTPFSLLTALYYAKLFGVDDHVQISPLFETAQGLQRGDRVIAELLDNPHFLTYIRSQQRFAVQLGFSDSGRYIGQVAANLAIERFKLRLVRLWEKRGLTDVPLLFFDTHGESIGRGAHPDSLTDRFLTTHTPKVRAALATLSAAHKHEVSFQGGDGYLWFASKETALATLTDFLLVRFGNKADEHNAEDRFYSESGWSLDFFLTIREFQDQLAHHPGYVAMLDSFAPNLLFPTGSRASKRQGAGLAAQQLTAVNQIRAIPNNAMLHQLGFLANVVGGIGMAIDRAPEQFQDCLADSPRLQRLMRMVAGANAVSSISTLMAYVDLMNPGWWLDHATAMPLAEDRAAAQRLSIVLETAFDHEAIGRLIRELRRDNTLLRMQQKTQQLSGLQELHAQRISEIRFIFLKAMEVPRFSSRMDVSLNELILRLLRLEVPVVIAELRQIFPTEVPAGDDEGHGEKATYKSGAGGYLQEHSELFDPIEAAYDRILELSAAIALKIGSFG